MRMNGAPGGWWLQDAGILRCAQNDTVEGSGISGRSGGGHGLHVEDGDYGGDQALNVGGVGVDAGLLQQLRYGGLDEREGVGELLRAGAALLAGRGVALLDEKDCGLDERCGVGDCGGCGCGGREEDSYELFYRDRVGYGPGEAFLEVLADGLEEACEGHDVPFVFVTYFGTWLFAAVRAVKYRDSEPCSE